MQNRINEWLQPLVGIGEDAFALNESFAEGESILDFDTLLAYDQNDHAFQQQAKQERVEGYVPEPYTGGLNGTGARALVEGRLYYLTLEMMSCHLVGTTEEAARAEIEARIPHRRVPGPDDGKCTKDGAIRWDQRVEAGGQEALQHRVWDEEFRRRLQLSQQFSERCEGGCYLDDAPREYDAPDERNLRIVFDSPAALASVRYASFLSDCRRTERPLAELRALEAAEVERMRDFVAAEHEDLVKNFDPKLEPLRGSSK